jgi:hypothetical protein
MLKIGDKVILRGVPKNDHEPDGTRAIIVKEAHMCDYFTHGGKLIKELCYAVETPRCSSLNVACIYAIPIGEDHA